MLKNVKTAFHIKELRKKMLFTFLIIMFVRLGAQIPIPGVDTGYFKQWFASNMGDAFSIFSAFTGGSFERMSLFALGVTPYITASIIVQLMAVVIPSLEELHKDGDYGQKKIEKITRWTALVLALLQAVSMTVGFAKSGLFPGTTFLRGTICAACMTGGSALLILMGELVKKKGVGNGISIILMVNILSGIPNSIMGLFERFVFGKSIAKSVLSAGIILGVILLTVILVIFLNEAVRKVPVQYSKKVVGRSVVGGQFTFIPIKVNVAGVIPVIFASTILSVPQIVAAVAGKGYGGGISAFILNMVNQGNWFDIAKPQYSIGLLIYIAMIFFFAYFYTSISFNPIEVANNLRKQGGVIPGIRQGKPTEAYLSKIISRLVVIGSVLLIVVVLIPVFFGGVFGANVSFGGTSLIIVVGVIIETLEQIESQMQARKFKGFLAD